MQCLVSNKGQQIAFLHLDLLCMMSINSSIGYFSTIEVERLAKLNNSWYSMISQIHYNNY